MQIHTNHRGHATQFISLNEQWVQHYFTLEDADRALAANPFRIVDEGGYIFTLEVDGEIVGACALFNEGDGVYELARMAVTPSAQGRGYGKALMDAALAQLHEIGATRVVLLSNTMLTAAIGLYRRYGFTVVSEGKHPIYARCNIVMEKHLGSTA